MAEQFITIDPKQISQDLRTQAAKRTTDPRNQMTCRFPSISDYLSDNYLSPAFAGYSQDLFSACPLYVEGGKCAAVSAEQRVAMHTTLLLGLASRVMPERNGKPEYLDPDEITNDTFQAIKQSVRDHSLDESY